VLVPDATGNQEQSSIPLAELDRVVISQGVQVSGLALCELLRRRVPVTFLAWNGRLLGSFEPPVPPRGASRLLQYELARTPASRLLIARKLIEAKISNGRRLLQRLDANHHRLEGEIMSTFQMRERDAATAADLATLRGHEGIAAALFFAGWAKFLPVEFPFGHRSTRPPGNSVNACLSYLSAIVYGELLTQCAVRGLDPALGCLHESEDGRWSLPLDLMEPFRPALIESLTLRVFSHRILQCQHFEAHDGGVWLTLDGRRTLIQHYEQRVQREFLSEHIGCRTTLRQQLQNAAVHFKIALGQPELFKPFRIN
jgi:CRISPR-associated protein Cas1